MNARLCAQLNVDIKVLLISRPILLTRRRLCQKSFNPGGGF